MSSLKLASATVVLTLLVAASLPAQRTRPKAPPKRLPIVFAVLNDGTTVEPIGYVEKGTLTAAVDGATEAPKLSAFHRAFFKPESTYRLIFGGTNAGTVSIKSSDPKAECSSNTAQIVFTSQKVKLKGNVMALATDIATTTKGSGVRRLPTPAERAEIETLVREFLVAQKVTASAARNLKYHNLTAMDVDADGNAEMVGTFWADVSPTSRALLFFIANKEGTSGKYAFGFTDFRLIDQKDVMSGEISAVDSGVYHERLLDVLDVNNDGVAEVFTYIQSFEGVGFNAYRRANGKWTNIYEGSNYHCGY